MACLIHLVVFVLAFYLIHAAPNPLTRYHHTAPTATRVHSLFKQVQKWQAAYYYPHLLTPSIPGLTYSLIPQRNSSQPPIHALQATTDRTSLSSQERQGLTLDYCVDDDDCASDRICADRIDTCNFSGSPCSCLPLEGAERSCTADANCQPGEVCVVISMRGSDEFSQNCVSAAAVPGFPLGAPLNESEALLSGERCLTTSQCVGDRQCLQGSLAADVKDTPCAALFDDCICQFPGVVEPCDSDDECDTPGDVCAAYSILNLRFCTSKVLVDTNEFFTHQGLTGELCISDQDCLGERECLTVRGETCTDECRCFFRDPPPCTSNVDCTRPLEICTQAFGDSKQQCASLLAAQITGFYRPVAPPSRDPEPSISPTPSRDPEPSISPTPSRDPEPSISPTPSRDPESSISPTPSRDPEPSISPTPSRDPESSISPPPSNEPASSTEVLPSTSPATANDSTSGGEDPLQPSLEPTENTVCVDANSLSHLRSSELVYPQHVAAQVLCDANGSCATAGHMVLFRGTPLRMSSYCSMVGCVPSVMLVNSPRLRIGVRISTKTEGLQFTALAAKFDTLAEEVALRIALRFGL